MSFPILNLVNAAATAVGLGWDSQRGPVLPFLGKFGCHTNGDDIVFACPESSYGSWKTAVEAAGLKLSAGKNYISSDFMMMNSEFRVPVVEFGPAQQTGNPLKDGLPIHWELIGFLNLPLLFGMEGKGQHAGELILERFAWWDTRPLAHALVRGCPPQVGERRMRGFLHYYEDLLRRTPPGVGWYDPPGLGGLGLPWIGDDPRPTSDGDRLRAAYLSMLDTKSRLKAVRPPSTRPVSTVEKLLDAAMRKRGLHDYLVVLPKDFETYELAAILAPAAQYGLDIGSVLAEVLDLVSDQASTPHELYEYLTSWYRQPGKPQDSLTYGQIDMLYSRQREFREQSFRNRIMGQNRKAKSVRIRVSEPTSVSSSDVSIRRTVPLTPMSQETMLVWSDRLGLVEDYFASPYTASIPLTPEVSYDPSLLLESGEPLVPHWVHEAPYEVSFEKLCLDWTL